MAIDEQDAPVIERVLALHDQQLIEAPMHWVVEAKKQLRQFLTDESVSPLVRPSRRNPPADTDPQFCAKT